MRELTLPAPLVMLPGLAADARLFGAQRRALGPHVITPEWPALAPGGGETLRRYARRWAGALHLQHVAALDPGRPWCLAGASMGGMVAQEMLAHLPRPPHTLLLIGSSRRGGAVSRPAQLGAALAGWVNRPGVLKLVMRGLLLPSVFYDGQDDDGRRLLGRMAADADPARLQWGVQACVDWPGVGPGDAAPGPAAAVKTLQIHGAADRIIPGGAEQADVVVPGAGHFLSLSHDHTVNRWLFDAVSAACGIEEGDAPRVEDPRESWSRRPEVARRF